MKVKIIIAPDSYKGSLSAVDVAEAIKSGIKKANSSIETVLFPLADGGEGTVATLIKATAGEFITAVVKDPKGRDILAHYGVLGDKETCVIETAAASGLTLLKESERNPLITTSYGTGQLINDGLNRGYRKFIIGLGGSATNDGGVGLLQALGVKFTDQFAQEIPFGGGNLRYIEKIDISQIDSRLRDSTFIIASDVNNPLIGPKGASHIFGPQKGADESMIKSLDENLTHLAGKIEEFLNISISDLPGAGAAGGIGGALIAFLNGKMEKGIDLILKTTILEEQLQDTALVITGEGQMDYQTAYGKTASGIAKLAKKYQVPVIAIVGSMGEGINQLRDIGIDSVVSIINKPMSLEEAFNNSYDLISETTEQIMRIYLLNTKV